MKDDQRPLKRPAAHSAAAAAAQYEEDREREENLFDSEEEDVLEAVPKQPRHVPIPKPVVADPRQGRASAEALRDSHPVTASADAAASPNGLAKGVSVYLGNLKDTAQGKSKNRQLEIQLAKKNAAIASCHTLVSLKDKKIASQDRQIEFHKRQVANLSSRLQTEGQSAFDKGYKHALSNLQPVHRFPPVPDTTALLTTVLTTLVSNLQNNNNTGRPPYRGNRAGKAKKARIQQHDKSE